MEKWIFRAGSPAKAVFLIDARPRSDPVMAVNVSGTALETFHLPGLGTLPGLYFASRETTEVFN